MSRTHVRLSRPADACRPVSILLIALWFSTAALGADTVTGVVVDQAGQPLSRALVTAGRERTFADEAGRFHIGRPAGDCRLEISLSGFQTATAACDISAPLRIVLTVAPIAESIVVTATRTEAPAGQIGASMTTFRSGDLERREQPLIADLLRAAPGAVLVRSGGPGSLTSLFVRGGESNYNKVLLDGIPLNEPGGTFNFSNLTTDSIERVEIVRGAHSALFGSDAMASVVQLFTKRADRARERPRVSLAFSGGTYATFHGDAGITGRAGRFDYGLGVGRFATDNRVPNNAFGNTTLSANGGVALGPNAILRVIGRGDKQRVGTPGQTAFGRPDLDAFFERRSGLGGILVDHQATTWLRERASYSLAASHQASTNLSLDPPYTPAFRGRRAPFEFFDFPFDSHTNLNRHHASYQADWRLSSSGTSGDHLLTALVDWDGERATLEDRLGATVTKASRNNFGWSVQHQALWPRVFVTAGARIEHNGSFGSAAVPRGTIAIVARRGGALAGETRLKAAAGRGIKEPTILQSFSPSPFFLGNPDLEPERSRTVEVGAGQRLLGDRAKVEATWFDNSFRNIISTRTLSFNPFRAEYFNVGLTRARGAELGGEIELIRAVRVRAGYTFLDSEIVESTSPGNVVFQQGQWAFRRPRHSGSVEGTWNWQRLAVDLRGLFIGRFVDSDFSALEPPIVENAGYTTWDARVRWRVAPGVSTMISIDNLTNAEYMEALGYPALGRAARLGVRVGF